jgi:mRNA-degrading endonuclease YafQ of YafQ-DinJ toxin-antitoxin module
VRFTATENFWRNFYALPARQKQLVREKWQIFKIDPFDPRLGTHKINSLSARMKQTVRAVVIEGDLRAVFVIDDDLITTIDIGTHSIYR